MPDAKKTMRRTRRLTWLRRVLEIVDRLRPVVVEEAGERAVGEEFAAGLAAGAVVGLVFGVDDVLHGRAAVGARFAVAAVDRHAGAKGGHLFGEGVAGVFAEAIDPVAECGLH